MQQTVEQQLEQELVQAFQPTHISIENESHMHRSGKGANSHFKVILVSDAFLELSLVKRHQQVYQALADYMAGGIHALALHTFTAKEWADQQQDFISGNASLASPHCQHRRG